MSNEEDIKALKLLEKAVYKAQDSLEKTKRFQPFLILLTATDEVEIYENDIEDSITSYESLEAQLSQRLEQNDIEVMVLVVDTVIPSNIAQDISSGIRLHLEEKSQQHKKIGARFLYVPYELVKIGEGDMFARLHTPIPVGLPAEYII